MHAAGWFDATILDHGFDVTRKGAEFFWVDFATRDRDGNEDAILGRFYVSSDKAAEITVEKIERMGYEGNDLTALGDGTVLKGNVTRIKVEHEEYNGKTFAKVAAVGTEGPKHNETVAANVGRFNDLLNAPEDAPDGEAPPFGNVPF